MRLHVFAVLCLALTMMLQKSTYALTAAPATPRPPTVSPSPPLVVPSQSVAVQPGVYTAVVSNIRIVLRVGPDNIFYESLIDASSQTPFPSCVVAGILGNAGSEVLYHVLGGGDNCGTIFDRFTVNSVKSAQGGILSMTFTNKTGTFSTVFQSSQRIRDGTYCSADGAKVPALLTVTGAAYNFLYGADGANFMCRVRGTVIGGPSNHVTVDEVTEKTECAVNITRATFNATSMTIVFGSPSGDIRMSACSPRFSQPTEESVYCGTLGGYSLNAYIKRDQTFALQVMPVASPIQPSPAYCALWGFYATMPGGRFRSFWTTSEGNCTEALSALGKVQAVMWRADGTVQLNLSATTATLLRRSQCLTYPSGSYGGIGGGYAVALTLLPNEEVRILVGAVQATTTMLCGLLGKTVNSTAAALHLAVDMNACSALKSIDALRFTPGTFTMTATDSKGKRFTVLLR